jgi:hypothetical protein
MTTRRLAIGLAAVAGLVLSLALAGPSGASMPPDRGGDGIPSRPDATTARGSFLRDPVAIARDATRKFRSDTEAKSAGYGVFRDVNGIACIAMHGMGVMGVHLVNGAVVGKPTINIRKPEALVYQTTKNGDRKLVALEYLVLRKDWEKVHGKDAPRPMRFGHRFDFTPKGNRFGLPPFYSLHAWIWKHNPAGTFAPFNPNSHCCHCSG